MEGFHVRGFQALDGMSPDRKGVTCELTGPYIVVRGHHCPCKYTARLHPFLPEPE